MKQKECKGRDEVFRQMQLMVPRVLLFQGTASPAEASRLSERLCPGSHSDASCQREVGTRDGRAFRGALLGADEFQESFSNLSISPLHVGAESGDSERVPRVAESWERWPVFKVYERSLQTLFRNFGTCPRPSH